MWRPENTLAHSCRRQQWDELCMCLAQGSPVNQKDDRGVAPLQICAASGWTKAVLLLLKHGADVHLSCSLGWTALMQAVRNGHLDVVEILLDAGAKTSDRNLLGWDAISLAVESQNKNLLMLLVSTAKASELSPALAIACQLGSVDIVRYLLTQQADINVKLPVSGLTSLMLAACEGHAGIVEILLLHGANPNCRNSSNLTALDMALMNGHASIGAMLSLHPKSSLHINPAYPLSVSVPLTKAPSHDTLSVPCHGQMCPCTPLYHSPNMRTNSPEVFKFPPSPTCICASPNLISSIPRVTSHHSPTLSHGYLMPHNAYSCLGPSQCSSPTIPPWMFSYGQWHHKPEPKFKVKSTKTFKSWWQKLKRCKRKNLKKRIKFYVTFDEKDGNQTEQFENLLCGLQLDSLIPLLRSHEIDIETFRHLRKIDLEEMGIVDKGLQSSILQKVSQLNNNVET